MGMSEEKKQTNVTLHFFSLRAFHCVGEPHRPINIYSESGLFKGRCMAFINRPKKVGCLILARKKKEKNAT